MARATDTLNIIIACGGTGGHVFPGLALAEVFQEQDCSVSLLISQKEVDQRAVQPAEAWPVLTLPAVGMQGNDLGGFLSGLWQSFRICANRFQAPEPHAVLAMGGFTSVPAILAARAVGTCTFLHEANAIPGKANRWLAPVTDASFAGFQEAVPVLGRSDCHYTGTPVRPQFSPLEPEACRAALGLDPAQPVLLVMGGSQGATFINHLVSQALPLLAKSCPRLQFVHLTGDQEREDLAGRYRGHHVRAIVRPFLTEMELALGAATLAVSRAGASSLAEFAAMEVPAILIPYPTAADNHQFYNARALTVAGAARQMDQSSATPETLARHVAELLGNSTVRGAMKSALRKRHTPDAASRIVQAILNRVSQNRPGRGRLAPAHRTANSALGSL